MDSPDPDWIAPRTGHDWRDEDVRAAVNWLKSFVPATEMDARLDAQRGHLANSLEAWKQGEHADAFDPSDAAAWWIIQGEAFAAGRESFVPDAMVRSVPYLKRLGLELARLRSIPGAEDRAARLMMGDRRQPEPGIYELLVALAWSRHGWDTRFVQEVRGGPPTPDLHASQGNRRWAIECKRLMPSAYAINERQLGLALAEPVHRLRERRNTSFVLTVDFKIELQDVPAEYLVDRVEAAFVEKRAAWSDEVSTGAIAAPTWPLVRRVMAHDDVFYGSSRMIELVSGSYNHEADHSFSARWRPAKKRPIYAHTIYQTSVVTWTSSSPAAIRHKAKHFRQVVAKAERQLPPDRPGVVHVGVETVGGRDVNTLRHVRNMVEAYQFMPANPRLRWVYANYFRPELTTDRNETWALTESMAPYRIGRHATPWPLPDHLLVSEEAESDPGLRF